MRNQRVARELGGAWCQADITTGSWLFFFVLGEKGEKYGEMMSYFSFFFG